MRLLKVEVKTQFRDSVAWEGEVNGDQMLTQRIRACGSLTFLRAIALLRSSLNGPMKSIHPPKGASTSDLIIRELILRIKGEWRLPYIEAELCHCRAIPTETVEQAIIYGAHTVESVATRTTAGTACTTCRPNSEKIINYRLGRI